MIGKGLELLSANGGRFEINHLLLANDIESEVDCFKYLGSQVATDGGCKMDIIRKMNESYIAWER